MAGKVDLKVVLLGKEYGGKTSLVERYIHNKFNSSAPYQSVSSGAHGQAAPLEAVPSLKRLEQVTGCDQCVGCESVCVCV